MKNTIFQFYIILIIFPSLIMGLSTYNVISLGAKPDGKTDSTNAFIKAWYKACGTLGKSVINVPKGRYLIRNAITFQGGRCKSVNINFVIKGTIVAPSDYRVLGSAYSWFSFESANGVTITGGKFDAKGVTLWNCKLSRKSGCPSGAATLAFTNSKNINIRGVTSINSQLGHISINGCNNVNIRSVKILASDTSPNTDGIHVQLSNRVTILKSKISTGDDCISIGAGTTALRIENVLCGPGHGISIGSLAKDLNEPGVENVIVNNITFVGTQNGVRIKSWGRPSNGFVKKVLFQHCTMINVQNPIIIDQNYCPGNQGCPGKASGVKISDITYQDIHGTSATEVAVKFDCSAINHCQNIKLDNVKLSFNKKQPAKATCAYAEGSTRGLVVPKSCLY